MSFSLIYCCCWTQQRPNLGQFKRTLSSAKKFLKMAEMQFLVTSSDILVQVERLKLPKRLQKRQRLWIQKRRYFAEIFSMLQKRGETKTKNLFFQYI
jgi:hypothetical protein